MKKSNAPEPFRFMDEEVEELKDDEEDVLTEAELNRLAYLAEHPELADPIIGLLPAEKPRPRIP